MDREEFNKYRSETLWPELKEHLREADTSSVSDGGEDQGIETVPDYLQAVEGEVLGESWCEDHSEALHIFTRYYPYTEQDVTLLLNNPRSDTDGDEEDGFPTLEHRRYAATEPDDIETLVKVSAEHYNNYLIKNAGPQCFFKRLGAVTGNLNISNVAEEGLSAEAQWDGKRGTENTGVDSSNNDGWDKYFYNPNETQKRTIADMEDTVSPRPKELPDFSSMEVNGEDRGLSAQSPDLGTGFYSDFYVTNVYKFGTHEDKDISTNRDKHVELSKQEIKNADSKLVIAMGVPAQQVLIDLAENDPVFDPSSEDNDKPNNKGYSNPNEKGQVNYGVVWKLNSEQYGLSVPHPSRFNAGLGCTFDGNSKEGWKLLSDSLHYIGSETDL
jgi:hypothetical protein